MLHDESFVAGLLIGRKQGGGGTGPEMIKKAAAMSDFCDIWRIPKYDAVTDAAGNLLTVDVQRMRRLTYVVDVLRVAYKMYMHLHGGSILAFGNGSGLRTHTYCNADASVEPADYGTHPVNWTSAKSVLVVSDSLVAVIAEHPELGTPVVLTGFIRVLAAKPVDKDNWRPIYETAFPRYSVIQKDNAFTLTQGMDLVDDLTDKVLDTSGGEELIYENGSAGYFRGIRCVRSQDGQGQYVKTANGENNYNFIGSFDAVGTCAARNDAANTSQMYLCGFKRDITDDNTQTTQTVVDRWWMTITGTGPNQRGLLPRENCTYDYNSDEVDNDHKTYQEGYDAGHADGYDAGYDAGYAAGLAGGGEDPGGSYDEGYQAGYTAGYAAGQAAAGDNNGYTLGPAADGATELYISIEAAALRSQQLCFCQTVANGVTVDWGDGSAVETVAGTGPVYPEHNYNSNGDYVIRLIPADGCTLTLGGGTAVAKTIFNDGTGVAAGRGVVLRKAVVGKGITMVGRFAFRNSWALEEVYIQDGVEALGESCFQDCGGLHRIRLPSTLTSLANGAELSRCYGLGEITIPTSVTAIGGNTFTSCYALKRVSFPAITKVEPYAVGTCRGLQRVDLPATLTTLSTNFANAAVNLREIHIAATTPPPLTGNLAIPSTCKVYIPTGSKATYAAANYWKNIAARLIEE